MNDEHAAMKQRLTRFWPWLAIVGLVLLFFNKMVFSNLILARGDTFLYFYPYWQAAAEALRHGRLPLWNPSLFMGVPLLANSQVGFFYPLNWPVWLLRPTPYAVSASIVLHLIIGGWGAYLAGRRRLGLGVLAGLLTAVLFALGGYLTAQVEHVNQVQGLAWLPWLLVALPKGRSPNRQDSLTRIMALGLLFALQLLAGHTQTAFISGVAVGVWVLANAAGDWGLETGAWRLEIRDWRLRNRQSPISNLLLVLVAVLLALLLTAVQLLPTLELTSLSSRQGGLTPNEVLSFSWHPLLIGRSLLPAFGQSLFSEYVAFLPITALVLAVMGAWQWRRRPGVLAALALTAVGLFLALGVFNPLYWLLARLPGFDLFRVPARWLALYALGAALLAGAGLQMAVDGRWEAVKRPLRLAVILVIGLMAWNIAAGWLSRFLPMGPEAPFERPSPLTWGLWLGELALVAGWLRWRRGAWGLAGTAVLVLFLASRSLPYNNLTTPEAWFDLRPPAARLLGSGECGVGSGECGVGSAEWGVRSGECGVGSGECGGPPDRMLSLSAIFFDPGDLGEIESIYADQLGAAALYDYVVAIKQKEIIAPNLPLAYGLASVDGFDGGVLPLRTYSELMSLILPQGEVTTDGRLREHLDAVPEAKWLDLFNGRYLITDKTGDQWRKISPAGLDVFFDLQHPQAIAAGEMGAIAYLPPFAADGLAVLSGGAPGAVVITTAVGETRLEPTAVDGDLVWFDWRETAVPQSITMHAAPAAPWQVQAATMVNAAEGTFMSLTLGDYRLIHSGDVKIYENLNVLPRAVLLANWQWQPDETAVLAAMQAPDFDPRQTAVLLGEGENLPDLTGLQDLSGLAQIISYAPEKVVVQTNAPQASLLLFTDADYPGWQATLDGRAAAIIPADGLFRGVLVPAGEHEVVFTFRSQSLANGRVLSLAGWGLLLLAGVYLLANRFRRPAPPTNP
ncbi:MAG: hypothetical protein KBE23_12920 [Chloroflexi bacterium]|nr:hypothetical protein [Chloroflexota bacterium]MBP7043641.1 hypothetical protein [Chloroflexota bacterium]